MAHRRIGQGVFRFGTKAERQTSLDELGALIDWSNADRVLASLYKAVKGEKAWPPLAMFKAGGTSKLLRKGHRHLPAERLEAHNRSLCPIRARIGKIFGTWKRTYRFRCMRWIGLSKAKLQVHLAVIAYNCKRYWRMHTA
jgi:hypothetical protein